jgi:membrane fusion protein (multidrug efflux system)
MAKDGLELQGTSAPAKTSNWKLWTLAIVLLLAVIGGLAYVKVGQIGTMIDAGKNMQLPPDAVATASAQEVDWEGARPAIGSLVAIHSSTLGSELPGLVTKVEFESGAGVRSGQVLVVLDSSTEEAQLQAALADQALAKQSLARARELRESNTNTAADLDAAEAKAKQADAAVATLRTTIAKKTIRAPFDGRVGIRYVERGQVLAAGATIATLQSVNPIYAEFSLPQQTLAELQTGMRARLHTDIFGDQGWEGRITTINSEVDVATRNVRVRATFPNADGRLRPGMFVNVSVLSASAHKALVIPATAVIFAPYGDSVFVVEPKKEEAERPGDKPGEQKGPAPKAAPPAPGKPGMPPPLVARQQFIRLGERRGDLVAVESGIKAGETVVSAGAFKLHNGGAVLVRNDLAPKAQENPQPVEK